MTISQLPFVYYVSKASSISKILRNIDSEYSFITEFYTGCTTIIAKSLTKHIGINPIYAYVGQAELDLLSEGKIFSFTDQVDALTPILARSAVKEQCDVIANPWVVTPILSPIVGASCETSFELFAKYNKNPNLSFPDMVHIGVKKMFSSYVKRTMKLLNFDLFADFTSVVVTTSMHDSVLRYFNEVGSKSLQYSMDQINLVVDNIGYFTIEFANNVTDKFKIDSDVLVHVIKPVGIVPNDLFSSMEDDIYL